jgi:uncharacterized protein
MENSTPGEGALTLRWLPGRYAICRLGPHDVIPPWAVNSRGFLNVTRTADEMSIVVEEDAVSPAILEVRRGWSMLRVVGRLDFSLVGILARLTMTLANVGVPVVAVSTFDTDYLLVPAEKEQVASRALKAVAKVEPRSSTRRA